jgi:lipopolysaccharide biosynthesis regulator YciM
MALTDSDGRMSHLVGAKNSYGAALGYGGKAMKDPVMDGASTWRASLRLATVLLQLGEQATAIDLFQASKEQEPELSLLGIAEALIGMERPVEALNLLRGLIEQHESVDGAILAAHVCLQQNEIPSFQALLQCAYDGAREGLKETHRLKLLNDLLAHPAQAIRKVG